LVRGVCPIGTERETFEFFARGSDVGGDPLARLPERVLARSAEDHHFGLALELVHDTAATLSVSCTLEL